MQPADHVQSAEVIEVVKVVSREGTGREGDPCRYVTSYYSPEGGWLATNDPIEFT